MLLLDSNVVSALMNREHAAWEHLRNEDLAGVFVPAPVAAEIRYRLERLRRGSRRRLLLEGEYERLRSKLNFTEWDETAAVEFGKLKADLERRGLGVEDMDVVIASIAVRRSARLATRNLRHFTRIEGLRLEDWAEPLTGSADPSEED